MSKQRETKPAQATHVEVAPGDVILLCQDALRLLHETLADLHKMDFVADAWPDALGVREMRRILRRSMTNLESGIELLPILKRNAPPAEGGKK